MRNDPIRAAAEGLPEHIPSYLDTIPGNAQCVNYWREDGHMVPIVKGGELWLLTNDQHLDMFEPSPTISAVDYVVGLELLGYRFMVSVSENGPGSLCRWEPDFALPETWRLHASRILSAFVGRDWEAAAVILQRNAAGNSIYVEAAR